MMPDEAKNDDVAASYEAHNAPTLARLCRIPMPE
jgi:hypothetical protein